MNASPENWHSSALRGRTVMGALRRSRAQAPGRSTSARVAAPQSDGGKAGVTDHSSATGLALLVCEAWGWLRLMQLMQMGNVVMFCIASKKSTT